MTISLAKLTNTSGGEVVIGNLSFNDGEDLVYWDIYQSSSDAQDIFNELRAAEDAMHTLIDAGSVEMYEDGGLVASEDAVAAFDAVKVLYERKNNLAALVAEGVTLNENKDSRGNMVFVEEKRVGSDLEIATHNFADKTTWYTKSVRVFTETATNSGDDLTYTLANDYLIDLNHGKVHNEDKIVQRHLDGGGHGYRPYVFINGTLATEYTPFEASQEDCDFTVDYVAGEITFFESQAGNTITADYSYATTSEWVLAPDAGKKIDIEKSEVQFSADMVYTDAIDFEIWGYNPQDLPNKIMYEKTSYKSIHNFIDEAAGSYPTIPVCGGAAPLGKTQQTLGFPFNYNTIRSLLSSQGLELVLKTRNDREFGGERSTATFYCTIHDES